MRRPGMFAKDRTVSEPSPPPSRLQDRALQRATRPSRFQAQLLAAAYERLWPSGRGRTATTHIQEKSSRENQQ